MGRRSAVDVLLGIDPAKLDPDLGAQLLTLVQQARDAGVDAEQALRAATHHLADQIRSAESGVPTDRK